MVLGVTSPHHTLTNQLYVRGFYSSASRSVSAAMIPFVFPSYSWISILDFLRKTLCLVISPFVDCHFDVLGKSEIGEEYEYLARFSNGFGDYAVCSSEKEGWSHKKF